MSVSLGHSMLAEYASIAVASLTARSDRFLDDLRGVGGDSKLRLSSKWH